MRHVFATKFPLLPLGVSPSFSPKFENAVLHYIIHKSVNNYSRVKRFGELFLIKFSSSCILKYFYLKLYLSSYKITNLINLFCFRKTNIVFVMCYFKCLNSQERYKQNLQYAFQALEWCDWLMNGYD